MFCCSSPPPPHFLVSPRPAPPRPRVKCKCQVVQCRVQHVQQTLTTCLRCPDQQRAAARGSK